MIQITIPNNNINERKYILDVIFDEFLGLEYKLEVGSWKLKVYEIKLKNGNKLIFEDHFFNKFPKDLEYLKLENIPSDINFQLKSENSFIPEDDIPILYGSSNFQLPTSNFKTFTCGIDIFASCFFMLTRWEEYVNKSRDSHDRFPAYESLAYKQDFLDRPIVNEYVAMLKNMLLELGLKQKPKTRNYQLYLTHDVDMPLKYPSLSSGFREIAGDLIKRKKLELAFHNFLIKFTTTFKIQKDPFDTFDYLMDISEKVGVKSYFFFMGRGQTKFDNMYASSNDFIKKLKKRIKNRGHHIGIHPTYNAYNDKEQFRKEKNELENNLDTKITFGREHYLRFEVPITWQIWEDNGMKWDSTLSFADKEGFRCGVCYEYSVFNILTRKKLKLKEKPLIAMDGSFVLYQEDMNPAKMELKIKFLIEKVKRYNGDFVFLWHNSSFNETLWSKYQNIYEKILK